MNDADASEFCDRIRDRLVGALTLTCGDRGVAEELAQDTLVRVWERWTHVSRMASPEGWAFRTAFNLAGSWGRRRSAERRANRRSLRPDPPATDLAEVEAVRRAVSALPDRQRAVIVARFYLGYDVAAAAALLGCAPGTVKAATHQAIANLRSSGLATDISEEVEGSMTQLDVLLERAADTPAVGFDNGDVRRRAQRRRRWRRSAAAGLAVLVVAGTVAVAANHAPSDQVSVTSTPDATSALEGGWAVVGFEGPTLEAWRARSLETIDAEIERQQDVVDSSAAGSPQREDAIAALGDLYSAKADIQTRGASGNVEFRHDGTFAVNEACPFSGHWSVEGGRLRVRSVGSTLGCSTPTADLFELAPSVTSGGGRDSIELRTAGDTLKLERAIGPNSIRDSELMVEGGQGQVVKATFQSAGSLVVGDQEDLATWTLGATIDAAASARVAIAIEGLPEGCRIDPLTGPDVSRSDPDQADWVTYDLVAHEGVLSGSSRVVVRGPCAGDYTLVLLLGADITTPDQVVQKRVPITIG